MRTHSEVLPAIDLSGTELEIIDAELAEPLARGFNSQAWRLGDQVVKVTRGSVDLIDADVLRLLMQGEHDVLEDVIGDHMPPTTYSVAEETDNEGKGRVVTVQPFMEGTALWDFLGQPQSPVEPLQKFLELCRQVYKKNKLMPDIGNIETAFNVFRNSNILISPEDDQPILVDTTFGKIQRSEFLGPIWTRAIYAGSLVASARLKLEHPRSARASVAR